MLILETIECFNKTVIFHPYEHGFNARVELKARTRIIFFRFANDNYINKAGKNITVIFIFCIAVQRSTKY